MFLRRLFLYFNHLASFLQLYFFSLLFLLPLTSRPNDLFKGHDLFITFLELVRTVLNLTFNIFSLDSAFPLNFRVRIYRLSGFNPLDLALLFNHLWLAWFGTWISWILLFLEVVLRIMTKGSSDIGSVAITIANSSSITSDSSLFITTSGMSTSGSSIGTGCFCCSWIKGIDEWLVFGLNKGASFGS